MTKLKKFKGLSTINITQALYDELISYSKYNSIMYAAWCSPEDFSIYSVPKRGMKLDLKHLITLYEDNTLVICDTIIEKLNANTCLCKGLSYNFTIAPTEKITGNILTIDLES